MEDKGRWHLFSSSSCRSVAAAERQKDNLPLNEEEEEPPRLRPAAVCLFLFSPAAKDLAFDDRKSGCAKNIFYKSPAQVLFVFGSQLLKEALLYFSIVRSYVFARRDPGGEPAKEGTTADGERRGHKESLFGPIKQRK